MRLGRDFSLDQRVPNLTPWREVGATIPQCLHHLGAGAGADAVAGASGRPTGAFADGPISPRAGGLTSGVSGHFGSFSK